MVDLEENMSILERKKKLKGRDACRCHDLVIRQLAKHGLDDGGETGERRDATESAASPQLGLPAICF